MLIYINRNRFVFVRNIKAGKIGNDLKTTCELYGVPWLMEVAATIDKIGFKEKPDYDKIKFQIIKILLDFDVVPE